MSLEGKVAIVTGSSRGIGKAIALGLAREGAAVVVAARTETERPNAPGTIHATAAEIEALGGQARAVYCNVREAKSIQDLVRQTLDSLGRIDVLVNNAGVGSYTPFLEATLKEWELVMDIDLRAPFICCQAVAPAMIGQGGGSMINISSHAATNIFSSTLGQERAAGIGLIGLAYGTAKAGLERFSWGLSAELGRHNIAVNVLKPLRPVLTEGFQAQRPDADYSTWATPEDMVKAAVYLANQDARGLTGAIVHAEEIVRRLGL
jgi:NAD(P)-dependent dehydrogenase (short-subunit alcohol dehydrogenase family)